MFPVRALCASEPVSDYLDGVLVSVFQVHMEQKKQAGDLLVFLTGICAANVVGWLVGFARTNAHRPRGD